MDAIAARDSSKIDRLSSFRRSHFSTRVTDLAANHHADLHGCDKVRGAGMTDELVCRRRIVTVDKGNNNMSGSHFASRCAALMACLGFAIAAVQSAHAQIIETVAG
jgi:hypothetical protein